MLPQDPHFRNERTTIHIEDRQPSQLWSSLLSFLTEETFVVPLKVTPKKYAITATVTLQGASCELKVRVYSQTRGFDVEFQRRSGDAIVFNDVYRRIVQELK